MCGFCNACVETAIFHELGVDCVIPRSVTRVVLGDSWFHHSSCSNHVELYNHCLMDEDWLAQSKGDSQKRYGLHITFLKTSNMHPIDALMVSKNPFF